MVNLDAIICFLYLLYLTDECEVIPNVKCIAHQNPYLLGLQITDNGANTS